jgi:hypothetical protein
VIHRSALLLMPTMGGATTSRVSQIGFVAGFINLLAR